MIIVYFYNMRSTFTNSKVIIFLNHSFNTNSFEIFGILLEEPILEKACSIALKNFIYNINIF